MGNSESSPSSSSSSSSSGNTHKNKNKCSPGLTSCFNDDSTSVSSTSTGDAVFRASRKYWAKHETAQKIFALVSRFECIDVTRVIQLSHVCAQWRKALVESHASHHLYHSLCHNSRPAFITKCNVSEIQRTNSSLLRAEGEEIPSSSSTSTLLTSNTSGPSSNSNTPKGNAVANSVSASALLASRRENNSGYITSTSETITNSTEPYSPQLLRELSLTELQAERSNQDRAQKDYEKRPHEYVKTGKMTGEDLIKYARCGCEWVVMNLLFKGKQNPNYRSIVSGTTALVEAVTAGKVSVVAVIIQSFIAFKHPHHIDYEGGKMGETALMAAIKKGDLVLARYLLDHGANPNVIDRLNGSAIFLAVSYSDRDASILKELFKKRDPPPPASSSSSCATSSASSSASSSSSSKKTTSVVLDANQKHEQKTSPLFEAVRLGHVSAIRVLLEHGARVADCVEKGSLNTALHTAIKNASALPIASLLIEGAKKNGEDVKSIVNASTSTQSTPLMVAAVVGDVANAKLLIENGANLNVRNIESQNAAQLAKQYNNQKVLDLLLEHNAELYH